MGFVFLTPDVLAPMIKFTIQKNGGRGILCTADEISWFASFAKLPEYFHNIPPMKRFYFQLKNPFSTKDLLCALSQLGIATGEFHGYQGYFTLDDRFLRMLRETSVFYEKPPVDDED